MAEPTKCHDVLKWVLVVILVIVVFLVLWWVFCCPSDCTPPCDPCDPCAPPRKSSSSCFSGTSSSACDTTTAGLGCASYYCKHRKSASCSFSGFSGGNDCCPPVTCYTPCTCC